VLNNVIKISFAIVGAITGYTLTRTLVITQFTNIIPEFQIIIYLIATLLAGFLFYTTGNKIIEIVLDTLNKIETYIQKMTLYELLVDSVGLIVGLVVANLVAIPVTKVEIIGVPFSIIINILFGCIGLAIAANKKDESPFEHFKKRTQCPKTVKTLTDLKYWIQVQLLTAG